MKIERDINQISRPSFFMGHPLERKIVSILRLQRLTSFIAFLTTEKTSQKMREVPSIQLSKAPRHVKVNEKIFVSTDTGFIGKLILDSFTGLQTWS